MIGKALAKELGIPFYDRVLIDKIAEDSGLDSEYIKHTAEAINMSNLMGQNTIGYGAPFQDMIMSVNSNVFASQEKVIRSLAENGPCVIVGRCADFILRERNDVMDLFIHSDIDCRKKRVVEEYGVNTKDPETDIKKVDKARTKHYSYYTEMRWGDAENYDMSLNSDYLGLEKVVSIITDIYRKSGG